MGTDTGNKDYGARLLLWLVGVFVVGCLICVLLAIFKVAVEAMVILAGVLIVVALLCIVGYNKAKNKILEDKLRKRDSE